VISTFDLTLLGSLVSTGGILFLCRGKRPQFGSRRRTADRSLILSEEAVSSTSGHPCSKLPDG
jgi:hypothetical protein